MEAFSNYMTIFLISFITKFNWEENVPLMLSPVPLKPFDLNVGEQ